MVSVMVLDDRQTDTGRRALTAASPSLWEERIKAVQFVNII